MVANLPYNMATEILFHLLTFYPRLLKICIMVQREVGHRLLASPGNKAFGRLSILPQIYYSIDSVKSISKDCFFPRPKVDSEFLAFNRRPEPLVDLSDGLFFQIFEKLIACIFTWRRKTLLNCLIRFRFPKPVKEMALSKRHWVQMLEKTGIDGGLRGERLSVFQMETLARKIYEMTKKGD